MLHVELLLVDCVLLSELVYVIPGLGAGRVETAKFGREAGYLGGGKRVRSLTPLSEGFDFGD